MLHHRYVAYLCLLVLLAATGSAISQTVIDNPAKPASGVVEASLTEQWRLGGDDEDLFFGTIARTHLGPDGNLYILDGQLSQVHVISPDGEHLRTVSKEGDGPGEVRNPGDFFVAEDGSINILNGFPGKVVSLSSDGTPIGNVGYSIDGKQTQFGVFIRGMETAGGMILGGINMTFGGGPLNEQNYYLARCDGEGNQINRLAEKNHTIDYSNFRLTEESMDFIWARVASGPDGQIYMALERDDYSITVMDPDGTKKRIINRAFQAPERTERQKTIATQIIEAIAVNYRVPLQGSEIEQSEPAVGSIAVTNDNRIWVQPGVSDDALPKGTWAIFDVFDPDGHFEKQVALKGSYNRNRDSASILPDGRILVITGALDAFLNQMGALDSEDAETEVDPLEIICYKLEK
jgi:hypothetical protein